MLTERLLNQGPSGLFSLEINYPKLVAWFLTDHASAKLTTGTHRNYELWLDRIYRYLLLNPRSTLIDGTATLYTARMELREALREMRRKTPVQANRTKSALSSMFKWALEEDLVTDNPVYGIPHSKENPKTRHLLDYELQGLLKAMAEEDHNPNTVACLQLILLTALRPGETRELTPMGGDNPLERGIVDLERREIRFGTTKNGHAHAVPLSPQALILLTPLVATTAPGHKIFKCGATGMALVAKKLAVAAKIPHAAPHDYRRTCATLAGSLGVPYDVIAGLLNHSPADVTRRHYMLYAYDKERRAALTTIGNHLVDLGLNL